MPSNSSRRATRKKQTRLTFDPVEPGSSAVMSPARVRYQGGKNSSVVNTSPPSRFDAEEDQPAVFSSSSKIGFRKETPQKRDKNGRLPFKPSSASTSSPHMNSSQPRRSIVIKSEDSDSEPAVRPITTNQELAAGNPTSSMSFETNAPFSPPTFTNKTSLPGIVGALGDDSSEGSSPEDEDDLPKRSPVKKIPPMSIREQIEREISDSPRKTAKGGRQTPSKTTRRKDTTEISEDEADDVFPTPRKVQRPGRRKQQMAVEDNSDEPSAPTQDSLPDISEIQTTSSRKRKLRASDSKRNQDSNEDSDDDVVISSSTKRRHIIEIDDDDEPVVSPPAKRRRAVLSDEDEDEDVFVSSPAKRLRQNSHRKGKQKQKTFEKDLSDHDIEKAQRLTRQKQTRKPHRTEREKKMELLRRKRAGEKITELTPSASEDETDRQALYDTDSDLQVLSEFEDEESEEAIEQVRHSLRNQPRKRRAAVGGDENDEDDDFIVEDDDEPLGVPGGHGLHDIPLEFTHQAHKPLKEHFKDCIEWMVQNRINPRFARTDPIYTRAFNKLDDEVRGYALSKFTSSVWRERFTRALWARPLIYENDLSVAEIGLEQKCDACGRTNHPAKIQITFGGRAYSKDTLEVIDDGKERSEEDTENPPANVPSNPFSAPARTQENNTNNHNSDSPNTDDPPSSDSDTSSETSSTASLDSHSRPLPPTSYSWNVGRFCASNASTAHSLIHWRHALNSWVIGQLHGEGELDPAKLAERQNWSTARAGKFANAIVDRWESEKVIKGLYRDFKVVLEGARESRQGRWG